MALAILVGTGPAAATDLADQPAVSPVVTNAFALPAPQAGAEAHPRPADGVYDLTGGGFGHGIGMSQYGAHGAALDGLDHAQILDFYYPGTNLVSGAPDALTVGITVDDDGILTVAARPGLAVTIGGTTTTLPAEPTQWRVRSAGATSGTCRLESYSGASGSASGSWTTYRSGTICPVRFSTSSEAVDVILPSDQRVYRGTVSAIWRSGSAVGTVNDVSMQRYLRSVVPSEMPPSWAPAALESQSVAARTYAARGSNGTSWYDTCDTTACQVYRGAGRRNADGSLTSFEYPATNSAVEATNDQVLTFRFSDGVTRLATTMYSSSNGGHSAAGGGDHTYLKARPDPYDDVPSNSRHAWAAKLPVTALEARFGIHRVERVQILSRDGHGDWGGRVLKVRVEGTTSGGAYTYVDTTGNGIMSARPWPTWSTGLSSNYFTFNGAASPSVTRLAGLNRYATAAAVAGRYPAGADVVYVASGLAFPDALAGAARAAHNDAPLLLTSPASLPAETRDAMSRLRPGRVVVLGGKGSVSDAVAESLRKLTTSGSIQRVAGPNRYATAANLAGYYPSGVPVVYVASGLAFPDALAGAAMAGRDGVPVLLTTAASLPQVTADALRRLAPGRIVVLGGSSTVSDGVLRQLHGVTSGSVTRIAGVNRYATAAAVAARYGSASQAYVASGQNFPDALAGAAIAGRDGAPLLLSPRDSLPSPTRDQLARLRPSSAILLGGTSTLSATVAAQVAAAIGS